MPLDTASRPAPRARRPLRRQQSSGRAVVRISSNTADVLEAPETVEDWDDEELRRGRRRDKNGKFTGADPIMIPTAAYREIVRRSIRRAEKELATNLEAACATLVSIATSTVAEDRDRIVAAKIVMERIMGKEPLKVDHSFKTPLFLGIIQGGIVTGGEPIAIGSGDDDSYIEASSHEADEEVIWE